MLPYFIKIFLLIFYLTLKLQFKEKEAKNLKEAKAVIWRALEGKEMGK